MERLALWFTTGKTRTWVFRLFIEPLRFGCLVASVHLIFGSVVQIPWLSSVFGRAGAFIAVAAVFISGLTAALFWIRHIEKIGGSSMVYLLIAFGLCFLYYMSIASYVFGVYPAIPVNRGGRMPVTEAYLETQDHESLFQKERQMKGFSLRGPVYILEQNSDTIYFASEGMDKWFERFVPVHALNKSAVTYIRFERIEDGFPRVQRKPLGQ
jgi:hypothetical protein